jgi:hypothetical protein
MNRGLLTVVAVLAMASLLLNAWLAANVAVLSQQVDALEESSPAAGGFPLTTTGSGPEMTFEDAEALAGYAVQTHDSLAALESALEQDVHRSPELGAVLELTHRAIDGREPTTTASSAAGESFLAYPEE